MKSHSTPAARYVARALASVTLSLSPAAAPAGDIHAVVRTPDGKGVIDAVVIAAPGAGTSGAALPSQPAEMDQRNKEFLPYVLPIQVGTRVHFPNHDDIRHHVYSFSPPKPFELPLYSGTPSSPVLFDKPGVVILGCNIHDWMVGYIYVSDSPYFARTDADGRATLAGLPAGDYTVWIWHPRLDGSEQSTANTLGVPASGFVETTRKIALKPDFRLRRAPAQGGTGY